MGIPGRRGGGRGTGGLRALAIGRGNFSYFVGDEEALIEGKVSTKRRREVGRFRGDIQRREGE